MPRRWRRPNVEDVTALEQSKSELLTRLCSYAESKGAKAPDGVDVPSVLKAFYRHVAPEDLLERDAADLYGACGAEYKAVQRAWTAVNVAGADTPC